MRDRQKEKGGNEKEEWVKGALGGNVERGGRKEVENAAAESDGFRWREGYVTDCLYVYGDRRLH